MKFRRDVPGQDEEHVRKRIWDLLFQAEQKQKEQARRLAQIEARSAIYRRQGG